MQHEDVAAFAQRLAVARNCGHDAFAVGPGDGQGVADKIAALQCERFGAWRDNSKCPGFRVKAEARVGRRQPIVSRPFADAFR